MQIITFWDYLLLPLYLIFIYRLAGKFRDRHYPPGHPWRQPFMTGLNLKIFGALFISLLYQYYYHYGDTLQYFMQGQVLNSAFNYSPAKWLNLVLHTVDWYERDYILFTSQMPYYFDPSTSTVLTASALVSTLTFNTFLPASILFAALAYTGMWAMYRTFSEQYPGLSKQLALAVLYVPSTFIWGSGIFKDTMCMFALGWLTYGVFRLLVKRDFSLSTIVITVLSFYLIAIVKIYILVAFIPALVFWVLFLYSHRIRSSAGRFFTKFVLIGAMALALPVATSKFSKELGKYSLEKVAETAEVTRTYLEKVSEADAGSGYSLGEIDPSPLGMIKKFPQAVNVTLFRPYLWESRKVIQLLNAFEATLFLLVTLKLLLLIGPIKVWRAISSDPNIQFCLIFTLIFGFAVGISTYNFGSLSRYRIPCLPLYAIALVLINYKYRPTDSSIFSFK